MQLKSKKKKTIKIAIIAAAILLISVIVGICIFFAISNRDDSPENSRDIEKISIAVTPKYEYYVGEQFMPKGIVVQVHTVDMKYTYTVEYTELTFSGFDSSVVNDNVVITVEYKGFKTSYTVKIKEAPVISDDPVLTSIRLSDNFVDTYSLNWWNNIGPAFDNVKLVLVYSDGSEKEVPMQSSYCSGMTFGLTSAGTTEFVIKYNDGGVIVETTVTVTITN